MYQDISASYTNDSGPEVVKQPTSGNDWFQYSLAQLGHTKKTATPPAIRASALDLNDSTLAKLDDINFQSCKTIYSAADVYVKALTDPANSSMDVFAWSTFQGDKCRDLIRSCGDRMRAAMSEAIATIDSSQSGAYYARGSMIVGYFQRIAIDSVTRVNIGSNQRTLDLSELDRALTEIQTELSELQMTFSDRG